MIKVKNLTFCYKGNDTLFKCDPIELPRKGVIPLMGANGSGKSTFLEVLAGIQGRDFAIEINGKKMSETLPVQWAESFSFLSQQSEYNPLLTGFELLDILWGKSLCLKEKERFLSFLKIQNLLNQRLGELSGGERQKVLLLGVFSGNMPAYLLDEPTVALDPLERKRFESYLLELSSEKLILLATHNLEILNISEKVLVFQNQTVKLHLLKDIQKNIYEIYS